MGGVSVDARPIVSGEEVAIFLPDPDAALRGVTLVQELRRPRLGPPFERVAGGWALRFRRTAVDRMEYQLHLLHEDGHEEVICDPGNARRAIGAFGEKSVVEWPEYRPPAWLSREVEGTGRIDAVRIPARSLSAEVAALVWTNAEAAGDEPLPLLVAHDGPEYAGFSGLIEFLDACTADDRLPPMRAALLAPVDRDQDYSASAVYARALAREVLPWLAERAPSPGPRSMRVAMGSSLGALAMLHVHRVHPSSFGGLFLQSGSFFRQRFDPQESSFVRFGRITRFVGRVLSAANRPHPIPVTMTCGLGEENLTNNRATAAALRVQGYDLGFVEHRDAHNWISWRDVFDPHLVDLLRRLWA